MHRYPHGYDGKVEEVRLQSQQLRLQLQVPWPAFFGVRSRWAGLLSTKITHQSRTDADKILEVETLRHDSSCVRFEWLEGFVYGFPLTFRTFQWCSRILTLAVVCCIMLISLFIPPRFVLVAMIFALPHDIQSLMALKHREAREANQSYRFLSFLHLWSILSTSGGPGTPSAVFQRIL